MMRPKTQDGCLPHQLPAYVIDPETAEELDYETVVAIYIAPLLEYVREKTKNTITADKQAIFDAIESEEKIKQPTGLAWKHGIRPDLSDAKDKGILATSRVEKVIQHRIVSEVQSYLANPNPDKAEPTFDALKANLGAADKQIATVTYDPELGKTLLYWKCWTRELLFIFDLPDFASDYDISKVCLPSVYYSKTRERVEFDFPFVEALDYSQNEFHHCYGAYDAGRAEPYRLAFKNGKGALIAEYRASGRCRALNAKRERVLANIKAVQDKLAQYDALGLPDDYPRRTVLVEEKKRLKAKAKAEGEALARLMGWEIARHCRRHGAAVLAAEDLSWVNDAHGSSRWNHSAQQSWVERECRRVGTAFMTVSAKGSSSTCSACGSVDVSHDSSKRTVKCRVCRVELDRDVSAARVLAGRCLVSYRKYMAKVVLSRMRMRC
ncbi:MAG: hypothetical protein BZ138_05820 [Methanosphaera sp. rholeuAM270]|nr:MAG: hypothetical protein BZ138_05820 [Methanosphaera sp. rholeuAM270]